MATPPKPAFVRQESKLVSGKLTPRAKVDDDRFSGSLITKRRAGPARDPNAVMNEEEEQHKKDAMQNAFIVSRRKRDNVGHDYTDEELKALEQDEEERKRKYNEEHERRTMYHGAIDSTMEQLKENVIDPEESDVSPSAAKPLSLGGAAEAGLATKKWQKGIKRVVLGLRLSSSKKTTEKLGRKWALVRTGVLTHPGKVLAANAIKALQEASRRQAEESGGAEGDADADDAPLPAVLALAEADIPSVFDEREKKRTMLRRDMRVRFWINEFWDMTREGADVVRVDQYTRLNKALYKLLVDPYVEAAANESAIKDWNHDRRNKPALTHELFFDSMFDLVENWTTGQDGDEYEYFLAYARSKIATFGEDGVARLRTTEDIDYSSDNDVAGGGAGDEGTGGGLFGKAAGHGGSSAAADQDSADAPQEGEGGEGGDAEARDGASVKADEAADSAEGAGAGAGGTDAEAGAAADGKGSAADEEDVKLVTEEEERERELARELDRVALGEAEKARRERRLAEKASKEKAALEEQLAQEKLAQEKLAQEKLAEKKPDEEPHPHFPMPKVLQVHALIRKVTLELLKGEDFTSQLVIEGANFAATKSVKVICNGQTCESAEVINDSRIVARYKHAPPGSRVAKDGFVKPVKLPAKSTLTVVLDDRALDPFKVALVHANRPQIQSLKVVPGQADTIVIQGLNFATGSYVLIDEQPLESRAQLEDGSPVGKIVCKVPASVSLVDPRARSSVIVVTEAVGSDPIYRNLAQMISEERKRSQPAPSGAPAVPVAALQQHQLPTGNLLHGATAAAAAAALAAEGGGASPYRPSLPTYAAKFWSLGGGFRMRTATSESADGATPFGLAVIRHRYPRGQRAVEVHHARGSLNWQWSSNGVPLSYDESLGIIVDGVPEPGIALPEHAAPAIDAGHTKPLKNLDPGAAAAVAAAQDPANKFKAAPTRTVGTAPKFRVPAAAAAKATTGGGGGGGGGGASPRRLQPIESERRAAAPAGAHPAATSKPPWHLPELTERPSFPMKEVPDRRLEFTRR